MGNVTADDFAAALRTAEQCLLKGDRLIEAAGKPGLTDFVVTLQSFCRFLDENRYNIEKVSEWHLRAPVSITPVGDYPRIYATAHRWAWRFAHRLWASAHSELGCAIFEAAGDKLGSLTEAEFDPAVLGTFAFKDELLWKNYERVAAKIAGDAKSRYFEKAPRLQIERAQGQAAWEVSHAATGAESNPSENKTRNVTNKSRRKTAENRDLILIRGALERWHRFGTDEENLTPASQDDLRFKMGLGNAPMNWDKTRISKAMKLMFKCQRPQAEYKRLLGTGTLQGFIARGDDGERTVDAVFQRRTHTEK